MRNTGQAEGRVECHNVVVKIDAGVVLPQPGHAENKRVRKGCDVECELFDMACDAERSPVEMGNGTVG